MIWTHLFHKQSSKTRWLFSLTLLKLFPFLQHWIKAIHSSAKIHQIVKSILLSIVCNLFLSFQKICSSRHHHCQNQESFHLARYRDPITSEQPVCHSTFEKRKSAEKGSMLIEKKFNILLLFAGSRKKSSQKSKARSGVKCCAAKKEIKKIPKKPPARRPEGPNRTRPLCLEICCKLWTLSFLFCRIGPKFAPQPKISHPECD